MNGKSRPPLVIMLLFFLTLVAPAWGGDKEENVVLKPPPAELELLTIDKAIETALANNLEYKAQWETLGVAAGVLTQAAKRPNPEWELGYVTDRMLANHGDREYSLAVAQTFETAGKRKYRILAARSGMDKVKSDVENSERALIADVKSAFYKTMTAERQLKLTREMLKFIENFVSTQTSRLREGAIPELALNLAKVELSRAQRSLLQAEAGVRTARIHLNQRMGVPHNTPLKLLGEFSAPLPEYDPDAIVEAALRRRPDVRSLENELKQQEYDLFLRKAEAKPNVTFGLELLRKRNLFDTSDIRYTVPNTLPPPIIFGKTAVIAHGPTPDPPPTGAIISQIADQHYFLRFKLSMPLPLFNRNQGAIESALAGRRAAHLKLSYLRETVRNEITTAYETVVLAQKARTLYETGILPQLSENLHIVTESYKLGAQSILAVIQEQRTFLEVNAQYLQTLSDFQTALILLESALGGKIDDIPRKDPATPSRAAVPVISN